MSATDSRRTLNGAVVVITGASGGIGRISAIDFARAGCDLVLAARRADALEETAALCRKHGVRATAVPTDVSIEADLDRLVRFTLEQHGRIDIWVNNAGTTLFGRLDEGEFSAHRRVLETNLIGPMLAARLLSPVLRRQKHGVIINVGSVLSQVGQAFVPAYAISKFGLQGLTEALRSEFADEADIHVCTVLPYAVDTPHFEDGGNVVGRRPYALPPVQNAEAVARAIVGVAARPRRERFVPKYAQAGITLQWLFPKTTTRLLRHALERFHMVGRQPKTLGTLFRPGTAPGLVHGSRRPVIGRVAFFLWLARDLGRMALGGRKHRRAS